MTADIYAAHAFVRRHCAEARIDEWSNDEGEDISGVFTHNHVLWIQHQADGVDRWRIQTLIHYSDPDVGIFNAEEPGDVILDTCNYFTALQMFVIHSTTSALNEHLSAVAESEYYASLDDAAVPTRMATPIEADAYRNWLCSELAAIGGQPLVSSISLTFDESVPQSKRDALVADVQALVKRLSKDNVAP